MASAPAEVYANGGAEYTPAGNGMNPYQDLTHRYDLSFEEFSEGPIVTTPEPATIGLLATGFLGIAGFGRRRRA